LTTLDSLKLGYVEDFFLLPGRRTVRAETPWITEGGTILEEYVVDFEILEILLLRLF